MILERHAKHLAYILVAFGEVWSKDKQPRWAWRSPTSLPDQRQQCAQRVHTLIALIRRPRMTVSGVSGVSSRRRLHFGRRCPIMNPTS